MANLFTFRSTNPSILDYVNNLNWSEADLVIACWGNLCESLNRNNEVISLISNLYCLKRNKNGTPHHILYLSKKRNHLPINSKLLFNSELLRWNRNSIRINTKEERWFQAFFFLLNAIYCTVFQFKLHLFLKI